MKENVGGGQWMEIFLKLIINSSIREIEMVDKWTNFENKRLYAMSSENQKSGGKRIHLSYHVFVKNSPNRFRITSTSISSALKQHCQKTKNKVLTFLDEFC